MYVCMYIMYKVEENIRVRLLLHREAKENRIGKKNSRRKMTNGGTEFVARIPVGTEIELEIWLHINKRICMTTFCIVQFTLFKSRPT